MRLPDPRVGTYLQALKAGLQALAPNTDFVSLAEGLSHLTLLEPAVSGGTFLPAEVNTQSGMPGFVWMERVLAEQTLALESSPEQEATDYDIQRAQQLDPILGERMQWRRQTQRILRKAAVLPRTRLDVVIKRLKGETMITATFDRMEVMGHWVRIRLDLSAPVGQTVMGPITLQDRTQLIVDPGFEHLLTRHSQTPFVALKEALEEVTPVSTITRLARSQIGPFWFPGISLPERVPERLNQGLVLNSSLQILARDVRKSEHADPMLAPLKTAIPEGFGWFQQRRFAASEPMHDAVRAWCAAKQVPCALVTLRP